MIVYSRILEQSIFQYLKISGLNIRDVLHEDESGSIEKSVAKLILDTKREKRFNNRPAKVRLGIVRKFISALSFLNSGIYGFLKLNKIGYLIDALCISNH